MGLEIEISGLFADGLSDPGVYSDGQSDHDIRIIIDPASDGGACENNVPATGYIPVEDLDSPQYRHTITVTGKVWHVDTPKDKSGYEAIGGVWVLPLSRDQRSGKWRK